MVQTLALYEKKILSDEEFPIQLFRNRSRQKGPYFDLHWHEHIELHYVVSGHTTIKLEQDEVLAHQGDLVVANSNILHEGFCDGTPMETLVAIFDMADFSRELADKNIIFQPLVPNDPEIIRIMKTVYDELLRQEIGGRLVCKGCLLQLVAYLVRHYAQEMLGQEDSLRRMKKLERLNIVYQYIERNYSSPISNRELADLIHVSEGRFSHLLAIAIQGVVMEQSAAVSVVEKALGARNAYRQSAKYLDYMLEAGVIAENQYGDRRVVITPGQARQIILPQLMEYPAAWSVSEVVEQLRKDIAFMLSDFWTGVDTMSGTEFEAWCMELLKKMGFEHVESTKATGDQGVDILAEKDEVPYAFQCKCYATDLGNTPVQEVYAGLRYYHRNVGVVITNRYFTTGAKALAKATDVLLWDRDRLKRIIQATEKQ